MKKPVIQPVVCCYKFNPDTTVPQPVEYYAADLMNKINQGIPLNRHDKNALTRGVNHNSFFKRAIPCLGWAFDFSDVLKCFLVKQYGRWYEVWGIDKTAVRAYVNDCIGGKIERIVEA